MRPAYEYTAASILIALFVLLAASSASRKSATVDECAHLACGLYAWKTGDFSLYSKTPPTSRLLETLPALALGPKVPDAPSFFREFAGSPWLPWNYGREFMRANLADYQEMLMAARMAVIFMGAALSFFVWLWSRRRYGIAGGLISLAACALSPTLIAHARLVTTDVAAALITLAFIAAMISYLERPSWARAAVMACALGLAVLTKFTLLFFAPFAVLAPAGTYFFGGLASRHAWRRLLGQTLMIAVVAWAMVCAGYLGKGMSFNREAVFASGTLKAAAPLAGVIPLPRDFVAGLDQQLFDAESGEFKSGNYFLGQWYRGNKWYYYPAAFLFKEPVYFLALLAIAVGIVIVKKPRDRSEFLILLMAVAYFAGAAAFGSLQIGVRYLLPAYPLLFVLLGNLAAAFKQSAMDKGADQEPAPGLADKRNLRRLLKALIAVSCIWALADQTLIWPDYLAYFSPAAGGPANGRNVLLDSNLDWGQDLPGLAKWMEKNNVARIDLAYFGHDDPARFGINYDLPGRGSGNGLVAISANYLMGMSYPVFYAKVSREELDLLLDYLAGYRGQKPVAMIGYSIMIYKTKAKEK